MLEHLRGLCGEVLREMGIEHEIFPFPTATALDEAVGPGPAPYDLLILDILMEGMTGMELARALRRRDDPVSIIFLTSSEEYLLEGYGVQPIHYLLKPVTRAALSGAVETDWRRNHSRKRFLLSVGGKTVSLWAPDIRYFESMNHSVTARLAEGERTFPLSLTEVERRLPPGMFTRCHNSYAVNMAYIEDIARTEITLRGGVRLPIGRKYYKSFQSEFIRYANR